MLDSDDRRRRWEFVHEHHVHDTSFAVEKCDPSGLLVRLRCRCGSTMKTTLRSALRDRDI